MAMTKSFTLHHHIARPISLHHHKPAADLFQHFSLIGAIAFVIVLAWLLHLAYTTLEGAPLALLIAVLIPLKAAVIILGFLLFYRITFKRELNYLLKKYTPRLEHAFKHK